MANPQRTPGLKGKKDPKQGADKFPIPYIHEVKKATAPSVTYPIDVSAGVEDWLMLGNGPDPTLTVNSGQPVGDCTWAGERHYLMAVCAGAKVPVPFPINANETVSGYLAYDHDEDEGCNMADLLLHWYNQGVILAFAPVDFNDEAKMDEALQDFHGLYVGVQLPGDADPQFEEHQPWSWTGAQIEGGHCIFRTKKASPNGLSTYVTWGAEQEAEPDWDTNAVDEAWVIVFQESEHYDIAALRAAIDPMGGHNIKPAGPTPQPVPELSIFRKIKDWLGC